MPTTYGNKVLTGDQLLYYTGIVKGALDDKQDTLVFNTAYNASSNKVATMSDIPSVPTNVSDLTNDSGFQTASQVQSAISTAISGISSFSFEVVNALPQTGDTSKIYLVAKTTSGTNQVYTEYIYVNNAWEIIGDTSISIETLTNAEIDTIWNDASAV